MSLGKDMFDKFAAEGRAQLSSFRPLGSPADVAAHQAAFVAACGKTAKKAAWRVALGALGIVAVNCAVVLGMFAGAVFIVLGALRVFGVI
jgi:hypothetical protein